MVNYDLSGVAEEQHCHCLEGKLSGHKYHTLFVIRFPALLQSALND